MVNWKKVQRDMIRGSSYDSTGRNKKEFVAFDKDPCKMLDDGDIDLETFYVICEARGLRKATSKEEKKMLRKASKKRKR